MSSITSRRLPAEWEKHAGTLLSFPHEGADWPGKYGAVQWAFVEMIKKVSASEPVFLLVKSPSHRDRVEQMLERAGTDLQTIQYICQPSNRNWMRDSGPIIVRRNKNDREALNFHFNGWAKYGNYRLDMHTAPVVASALKIPVTQVLYKGRHVVLEGGAIDSNGCGTLVTTEECLLDPSVQVRNPGFGREDYEHIFNEYLGITNVIWLGEGIAGDDTHGHVDDICRFVNAKTLLCCNEKNPRDENHRKMQANLERLSQARLEDGSRPEVVTIPLPGRIEFEGLRLPASYVNFMITNTQVLVPTFNDPNDRVALGIIGELFPDRNVVGIHALDLVWGLGTLHCLSHEIPSE